MREEFGKKWYEDNDPTHIAEIENISKAIDKVLAEMVKVGCG